jgi:hypothetical protein
VPRRLALLGHPGLFQESPTAFALCNCLIVCQKDSRNQPLWLTAGVGGRQWPFVTSRAQVQCSAGAAGAGADEASSHCLCERRWRAVCCLCIAAGKSTR